MSALVLSKCSFVAWQCNLELREESVVLFPEMNLSGLAFLKMHEYLAGSCPVPLDLFSDAESCSLLFGSSAGT
jgi:hypothetical protein